MEIQYSLRQSIRDHMPLYVFVSVLFIMGIVFGALLVNALSLEQKQEVTRYLGSFFHSIEQGVVGDAGYSFKTALLGHLKWILLIWLLGLSVVGLPLIMVLDFLKGVLIGFTVGYLVAQLSWKGLLFALVSVAPQNLIMIPSVIIASVAGITFSLFLIKNRFLQRSAGSVKQQLASYAVTALALLACVFAVSLFEVFISPHLMAWVTPHLIAVSS
ncbi:stage II sporulation protein M [Xylanibacillus composti]|uniref:Stage II sporulation protein M n=1 Tax=Xylanibacillus composti TaxID=1572762 RepID=A0A8J4M3C9_9BACL|nr:stage II sporulation protein M [Xylanibacillus composti]GIQ69411.1 stage II sporulation protein M [Xylanibacillus composti]